MTAEPTPRPAPRRATQDKLIADRIAAAQQVIETARDDAEVAALLATRGYDAAQLAEGLHLQEAAQAAFTARQAAMAAQKQATATRAGAETAARQTYADFRETGRAVFKAPADRMALGLTGNVPKDTQQFLTVARASYAAAQSAPYQATLATYGQAAATIAAALAALGALATTDKAQNAAIGAATKATAERDAAAKALDDWVRQFRRIAKVGLRGRPDLVKKLNP